MDQHDENIKIARDIAHAPLASRLFFVLILKDIYGNERANEIKTWVRLLAEMERM